MSQENIFFSALSGKEQSNLMEAKAAMTQKYLQPQQVVPGLARAFRASAKSIETHNIVGVGIDEKYVKGVPTGVNAVKFLVRTKVETSALSRREKLPASIDGVPTDVEEVGLIIPLAKVANAAALPNPRIKIRPIQPGSSIGFREPNNEFIMAGTFGALVKDDNNQLYILSNNHVLAFENGIDTNKKIRLALKAGAPIFQPGLLDGGKISTDKVAELTRWVDLHADQPINKVDGAIARVLANQNPLADILFIGKPTGSQAATKDMIVHKFGRTTSYRSGRVSSVFFDVTIPYEVGDVVFNDQIAIRGLNGQNFSDSGDSGSLILERSSNKAVGLLFAGATNGNLTFANHIADVLSQLQVQLV